MEIAPGKKLPVKNFPANESKTRKGLQLDALIESLAEDGIDQDRIDGLINALKDQWQTGRSIGIIAGQETGFSEG